MAVDWKTTTLGVESELISGFPFSSSDYTDNPRDMRLLRGDNIVQGKIRWTNAKRWPLDDVARFEKYELRKNDVVLAMDRPWIEAGLKYASIDDEDLPCLLLQRTTRLRGGPNLDIQFLRYVIGSPEFTKHIQSITTGSSIPHISSRQIKDFAFKLPPPSTQKRIAAVLFALDSKISLNHRINAELEAMAKLLYDYWFVQFDFPISAAQAAAMGKPKLEGKPYRTSGGPMVFNHDLKREIPALWKATQINNLVPIGKETINPSNDQERIFKLFSIPEFDKKGTYSLEAGSAIGSNKFIVSGTDLLVSKLNPWTSRVIYPAEELDLICSTEFVVLRAGTIWMKNFLYMIVTDSQFITFCSQSATGTSNSHKRVNPGVLTSYGLAYDAQVARRFGETIEPMLIQRLINQQQTQELTSLRDWLLPMLMNGQVTVG